MDTTMKRARYQSDEIRRILESDDPWMLVRLAGNADIEVQLAAIQRCGTLVSLQNNPAIHQLIDLGLQSTLVRCISETDSSKVQEEAAKVLRNITAETFTQINKVKKAVAVSSFIQVLTSSQEKILIPAVWALRTIIGNCQELKKLMIDMGMMKALLGIMNPEMSNSSLRVLSLTIRDLSRGDPQLSVKLFTKDILLIIKKLFIHSDTNILIDNLEAIANLAKGGMEQIQCIIYCGIVTRLIQLLLNGENDVQVEALQALSTIITNGTSEQTQVVLDCGLLFDFRTLLTHQDAHIVGEAVRCLSNIIAQGKLQAVIDARLLPKFLEMTSKDKDKGKEIDEILEVLVTNPANSEDYEVQLATVKKCRLLRFDIYDKLSAGDILPLLLECLFKPKTTLQEAAARVFVDTKIKSSSGRFLSGEDRFGPITRDRWSRACDHTLI